MVQKLVKSIINSWKQVSLFFSRLLNNWLVLLSSGQFSIDGEEADTKCLEYFTMLDEDEDTLVSFYDFLTPLMSTLPHEVAAMFT